MRLLKAILAAIIPRNNFALLPVSETCWLSIKVSLLGILNTVSDSEDENDMFSHPTSSSTLQELGKSVVISWCSSVLLVVEEAPIESIGYFVIALE